MSSILNFEILLKFIYFTAKFSGYLFTTISFKTSLIERKTNNFDIAMAAFSLCFSLFAIRCTSTFPVTNIINSKILEIGCFINIKALLLAVAILKIISCFQTKTFASILNKLRTCNSKVREFILFSKNIFNFIQFKLSNLAEFKRCKRSTMVPTAVYIIYTAWHSVFWFALFQIINFLGWSQFDSFINKFSLAVSSFLHTQFTLSHMMLLSATFYQLKSLNNRVKVISGDFCEKSLKTNIQKVLILHDNFCDVSDKISKMYTIPVILYFSAFAVFAYFSGYILFVFVKTPSFPLFYFLCYFLFWLSIFTPFILWTLTFSNLIENEGRKTAEILVKHTKISKNLVCNKIVDRFYLQVTQRNPKITCGFFDLNWKLFFSLCTAILYFTIILIQFYDVK